MSLHQGDQLVLRVSIKYDGAPLTPDMVDGVKVKIGNVQHTYPDGELTYEPYSQRWLFPVTQEQTLAMRRAVEKQVQINFGGTPAEIINSDIITSDIRPTIIKEVWGDN